jgi:hypothetical protein
MSIVDTVESQTLGAVTAVQDAVIAITRRVAARTEPVSKFLPQAPAALPSPSILLVAIAQKQLGLAGKIVANQKAFVTKLADVQGPAPSSSKSRSRNTIKDAA